MTDLIFTGTTEEGETVKITLSSLMNAKWNWPDTSLRTASTLGEVNVLADSIQSADYDAFNNHLGNLLAVIHRDGGHYQDEHGTEKAVKDAMTIIPRLRADLETHNTSLSAITRRLETEQSDNARMREALTEILMFADCNHGPAWRMQAIARAALDVTK